MKYLLPAAALTLLMTGVAAPALAQSTPDWSGPYIGIYGGGIDNKEQSDETLIFDRDLDGTFGETVTTAGATDAFAPGFCGGGALTSEAAGGCDSDNTGVEGSIRAGYDWQFGSFVAGVVAEWSAVNLTDTVTGFSSTPANYVFRRELNDMAALRARVGFATGPALVYITGGAAYGGIENSFRTTNTANSFVVQEDEDDADGWQAGAGLEWRLAPNLSVTGEYLYTSLTPGDYIVRAGNTGTTPVTNPFILAPNTTGTDITRSNDEMELHAFRIGMNVRF
ncbi:outer membrane protein [Brevundimonas sp. M20]|uniref:outer membrane protein n=1 Tax=Brevundimonas sp. M20 TaxID=2591463 RepID=UPI0011471D2C|nr:outer membrane beta-barrel protein [Brevundimonas sp. M20]QDH71989.1 porin family protein [Brevundimonas sp. M20]